jgi:toxin YoeB
MGKYFVEIEKDARKDINRLEKIISELSEEPRAGIGKPEQLKHYKEDEFWSRELNKRDRVVYQIIENEVIVIVVSALGHYKDK